MTATEMAQKLGYAGLIPFAFFALEPLLIGFLDPEAAIFALLAYAAAILSFLGGIVWGRAVVSGGVEQRPLAFVISVLPSLIGWVALLAGGSVGLLLCACGFGVMLWYDLRDGLPMWFSQLRLHLSIGAITACVIGLFSG